MAVTCRPDMQRRQEQGLCVTCGKPRERLRSLCDACAEKTKLQARERRSRRHSQGLCVRCCKPRKHYASLCDPCMIEHRQRQRARRGQKPYSGGRGRRPVVEDKECA